MKSLILLKLFFSSFGLTEAGDLFCLDYFSRVLKQILESHGGLKDVGEVSFVCLWIF